MKIAVCEDVSIYSDYIVSIIHQWSNTTGNDADVSVYPDAESLLVVLGDVIYDVLLLDIEMKNMTGIELAKLVRRMDEDVVIIFITSHSNYSLEGYDVNPLHYLIKPVSEEKLKQVLDKAYAVYSIKGAEGIVISGESGMKKILLDKILYISTMSHFTEIATIDEILHTKTTRQELEKVLPNHFINCHRTYIINMFKVSAVYNDKLILNDGTNIPVSRRRSKNLMESFMRLHVG